MYFRSFGFKPSGSDEYVAFGTPFTVPVGPLSPCKATMVRIRDKESYDILGYMRYTHTYKTRDADMLMYVSLSGTLNQDVFAHMAKDPSPTPPATPPPPEEPEDPDCKRLQFWTGVHLHEYHENEENNIFLRDGGGCGGWYPCAPASGGSYNPQNWGADWARIFCIDDTDCDGWTDDEENYVGTDSWDDCADGPSDDAWPLDIDNDRYIDVLGDVLIYRGRIGAGPGDPNWWQRLDLNGDRYIGVLGDVLMFRGNIDATCSN